MKRPKEPRDVGAKRPKDPRRGGAKRPPEGEDTESEVIYGVHPVTEILDRDSGSIERVLVLRGAKGGRIGRILRASREQGVPVSHLPKPILNRRVGPGRVHQGVAAVVSPVRYRTPDAIVQGSIDRGEGLLVALDGVEDPRNLGAILRSAAAAGVDGVLLARDSTAGVTPTALKTSAGTAGRLPIARDGRLSRRLGALTDAGYRVIGLDPRADRTWSEADLTGRVVVLAGGEGRGLRPGLRSKCNMCVAIPLADGVESLNVSVAVGIVLFEAVRQRVGAASGGNSRG